MRKIIYVTGTRADYGLMSSSLKLLNEDDDIDLGVCVTGMHLMQEYGNSVQYIYGDHMPICAEIPADIDGISGASMLRSFSQQIDGFSKALLTEKPDAVMVLGDRGEMLAAAITAIHLSIPLIHIHGGERSGSIDESMRHAISKLAHYHFTSTEKAKERLVRMGEKEEMVHVVGAPGLDNIADIDKVDKKELFLEFGFDVDKPLTLLVYHPVVQHSADAGKEMEIILEAMKGDDMQLMCVMPNSDAGGRFIREVFEKNKKVENFNTVDNFERSDFLQWMKHADIMVGNSSAGIIEAASFNLPVVNIGDRQYARDRSENVIDVSIDKVDIREGAKKALSMTDNKFKNIYQHGNAGMKILALLKNINLSKEILNKYNAY